MTDPQKFPRACRMFLARLLIVHGIETSDFLRRMANELEELAAEEGNDLRKSLSDPCKTSPSCTSAVSARFTCLSRHEPISNL